MAEVEYPGPFTKKAVFMSRESHPLLIDLILIKEFGPEYLSWEPETCWKEIELSFNTSLSEVNKGKAQALRTCHISDRPYEAWNVFEKIVICFGGGVPKFDIMQKPTPHACAAALESMGHIKGTRVSSEVYRYVAAILLDDGFSYAPGPLLPCNEYIEKHVGRALQNKVAKMVLSKKTPPTNSTKEEDIQAFKSISVLDYVEYDSKKLLKQIDVVIRRNE